MKKYSIHIAIIILILLIAGVVYISQTRENITIEPSKVKNSISAQFSEGKGHTVAIKTSSGTFSGELNATNFKGTYKSGKTSSTQTIISLADKNYTGDAKGQNWEENSTMYASQINMMTHPDWIQIQKQFPNTTLDGKTYLCYEILFEKPNQEITKNMTQEEHNKYGYFGTILVDTQTMELRQMKIHIGRTNPKSAAAITTVDYTSLSTPPVITAPTVK